MADEEKESKGTKVPDGEPRPFGFNPFTLDIPDLYVNNADVLIGASEISLVFAHNIGGDNSASNPLVRLTMTHYNFLMLMKYFNKRVEFLDSLYKDRLVTLNDVAINEPESLQEAFEKMRKVDLGEVNE